MVALCVAVSTTPMVFWLQAGTVCYQLTRDRKCFTFMLRLEGNFLRKGVFSSSEHVISADRIRGVSTQESSLSTASVYSASS